VETLGRSLFKPPGQVAVVHQVCVTTGFRIVDFHHFKVLNTREERMSIYGRRAAKSAPKCGK
jgi:hypothetical protein